MQAFRLTAVGRIPEGEDERDVFEMFVVMDSNRVMYVTGAEYRNRYGDTPSVNIRTYPASIRELAKTVWMELEDFKG